MMAKTLAVTLDGNQQRFIDEQVAEARFASADEVVSEGLRLLAEREAENARPFTGVSILLKITKPW